MEWDGHTVITVNGHFLEVSVARNTFSYMDALTIDDVFKTVVLAIPVGVIIIAIFSTHNRFSTLPFVTAQSGPRFIEISGRGNAFRVVS